MELPLFPLNTVLFPGAIIPIHVFEHRYRLMVGRCLEENGSFGVTLIKAGREVGGPAIPYQVGTTARIYKFQPLEDGRMNILARGEKRFRIQDIRSYDPYLVAEVELLEEEEEDGAPELVEAVEALFQRYVYLIQAMSGQWSRPRPLPSNPSALADAVAHQLAIEARRKQVLLETLLVKRRLEMERELLQELVPALERQFRARIRQRWGGFWALN